MLRQAFAILLLSMAPWVHAQVCPAAGTPLTVVRNTIDDYIRNDRAPAGADCAYSWASGLRMDDARLSDEVVRFFRTASDVQRTAASMRQEKNDKTAADLYLKREIELRRRFIREALSQEAPAERSRLRSPVVQNLSYLVAAQAMRGQYEAAADALGEQDPAYIDKEALKVWLQGLWSCANWDGKKINICTQEKRATCYDKITVFLDALNGMGARDLSPQTRKDIASLRTLTNTKACFP